MTPDELVREIFRIQEERWPNDDPGDMQIDIQDDMPLVVVRQAYTYRGENLSPAEYMAIVQGVPGSSIQDALENYLKWVQSEIEEESSKD